MIWLLIALACGTAEEEHVATPAPAPAEAPAPAPKEEPAAAPTASGKVFFVSPKHGEKVKSPVKIVMGVEGMEIKPAGDLTANTGHHHVIVGPAGLPAGTTIPADEKHIHFGKGQTEAEIELPPGSHQLTLQLADGNHVSYGEPLASTITIIVE